MKRFKNPWDLEAVMAHLCAVDFILPCLKGGETPKQKLTNQSAGELRGPRLPSRGALVFFGSGKDLTETLRQVEYGRIPPGSEESKLGMEKTFLGITSLRTRRADCGTHSPFAQRATGAKRPAALFS